jgi:peptidyl-prolyl cis-trans isomerase D
MLLSLMRKHAKSYLIKFLIAIIAIVFIFYFGYSFQSGRGTKVAVVNGEPITGVEYRKAYGEMLSALQRQYGNMWSDSLVEVFNLKERALQGLIDERLMSQEARRIGLRVTEDEVRSEIMAYPAFQYQGRFDERRYRAVLEQNRMSPEDFEATVAQVLLKDKVSQFLTAFLPVTEQEVREYYTYTNEQTRIRFVTLTPEAFRLSVELEDGDLEAYFKTHREKYRVPEQIRIAYIEVNPERFLDRVEVSDEELRAYYEENLEQYEVNRQVNARHILFKLPEDASKEQEERVRGKAREVLELVKTGGDFAELARIHSEGPTRDEGGELGWFTSGEMVEPFEKAAFALKPGEVSDLVRTPFGIHIIRVEDVREPRTKPLEEVRGEIRERLLEVAAADFAHERALSLIDRMPYDVDLTAYAEEEGVPVETSPFFGRNDEIPGLGGSDRLREVVFSLETKAVSDVIEHRGRFYIVQVVEEKESHLPELEEAAEQVREDLVQERARELARSEAEALLQRLRDGEGWEALVAAEGLEPQTSDFFKRGGRIQGIGTAPELQEAAFALDARDPYPERVFESENGLHVIRWEASLDIEEDGFREARPEVRRTLRSLKHQDAFDDWLENLRADAEIEQLATL